MKNILQNTKIVKVFLLALASSFIISCNKDLPKPTPIIYGPANSSSSTTIGAAISSDPDLTFFKAAATRVGVLTALSDSSKVFTVFLPDDNAFMLSGIPSVDVINALPLETVGAIVQYHIIPGEQFTSSSVSNTFPNEQLPSYLNIGTLPGTPVPLQMSAFPSTRAAGFWDNNIPVITPDIKYQNGVVHKVAAIVAPPSQVLRDALYSDPNLAYFKAAIARADSGQTGLNKFDSLLNYPVTNMTVLAPNNAAFQTLIFGLAFQGYLDYLISLGVVPNASDSANAFATANGAVAAGPAFLSTNNVSTALIRGVMAYHFLATDQGAGFQPNIRVFSVNFSATPSFVTTLVNSSPAAQAHPGILAAPTFTQIAPNASIVTSLKFTGLGTFPPGGAPYSGAPANAVSNGVSLENTGVNGVYYVIDQVLLPQ